MPDGVVSKHFTHMILIVSVGMHLSFQSTYPKHFVCSSTSSCHRCIYIMTEYMLDWTCMSVGTRLESSLSSIVPYLYHCK